MTYQEGIINAFSSEVKENGKIYLTLEHQYSIPRDEDCVVPEGWGLTDDDTYLYMSDGSHRIFRINPADLIEFDQDEFETAYDVDQWADESHFDTIYSIFDSQTGERLENIDELEMVNNNLYANLRDSSLNTFSIVKINTGVTGKLTFLV